MKIKRIDSTGSKTRDITVREGAVYVDNHRISVSIAENMSAYIKFVILLHTIDTKKTTLYPKGRSIHSLEIYLDDD